MRKHPEFYLSGRIWEAYTEQAEERDGGASAEIDAPYQKYITWVESHFPQALEQCVHLSKQQFANFKSHTYIKGVSAIGEQSEIKILERAHDDKVKDLPDAQKYNDIFSYHCHLIEKRLHARAV